MHGMSLILTVAMWTVSGCKVNKFDAELKSPTTPNDVIQDDSLMIYPKNFQVYQRDDRSQGKLKIRVKEVVSTQKITITVKSNSTAAVLATVSEDVIFDSPKIYEKSIQVPAGGWYSIEILQINSTSRQSTRSFVANFGVGDVFVIAGQSNSVNTGQELTQQTSGFVSAFDPKTNSWRLANDPQPPYLADGAGTGMGGSTWPSMGDTVFEHLKVPIGIAITGFGGTYIAQWQKSNIAAGHFSRLKTIFQQLIIQTGGIRMILWHQGEGDAGLRTSTRDYENYFTALKSDLTSEFGTVKIPWMVAKAAFFPRHLHQDDGQPCTDESFNKTAVKNVIEAQQNLIANHIAHEGPDTDVLVGPLYRYNTLSGSCVHFSKAGSVEAGKRWGLKVIAAPLAPYISGPITQLGDDTFNASWYLQNNRDLQEKFGSNLFLATQHWLNFGIREGRKGAE